MLSFTFIVFSVLIVMSNSNDSIGLQCPKPVRRHLHAYQETVNASSWARDVNGRDETETSASRDQDETETLTIFLETRRWYVSRWPSRDVKTEFTTLHNSDVAFALCMSMAWCLWCRYMQMHLQHTHHQLVIQSCHSSTSSHLPIMAAMHRCQLKHKMSISMHLYSVD